MAELLVDADPKSVPPSSYLRAFRQYLEEREMVKLEHLLLSLPLLGEPSCDHYSFTVCIPQLADFDPSLAFTLIHHPQLLLPIFEEALFKTQQIVASHPAFAALHGNTRVYVKRQCHIRICDLPPLPDLVKSTLGEIKAQGATHLVQVSGTILKTGGVRMLELSKQYECQNPRCKYRFTVYADPEQDNLLPHPRSCPRSLSAGTGNGSEPAIKPCSSSSLREVEGGNVCVDYQEIKLQDHVESLSLGSMPRSIAVILQADLVDKFHPGDEVVIVGRLLRQWRTVSRGMRCAADMALLANNLRLLHSRHEEYAARSGAPHAYAHFEDFWSTARAAGREWQAREHIVRAVCPQLCGMFLVKLALLLALIGGAPTDRSTSVRRRSEIHLLIVGDPGCGMAPRPLLAHALDSSAGCIFRQVPAAPLRSQRLAQVRADNWHRHYRCGADLLRLQRHASRQSGCQRWRGVGA
jgi:DNA helicase MCM9